MKNKLKVIPNLYRPTENYNSQIIDFPFNESNNINSDISKEKVDKMFIDDTINILNDIKVWQIHNKYIIRVFIIIRSF